MEREIEIIRHTPRRCEHCGGNVLLEYGELKCLQCGRPHRQPMLKNVKVEKQRDVLLKYIKGRQIDG
uniref:Uncharacterized protein n=1 Tax=viral metagenome TaxID=1070528 RepID=A0A6M3ILL2_9ZZZZ